MEEELPAVKCVPLTLSSDMCQRAPQLHQEDMDAFYNVQESMKQVETGEISQIQLVVLYMRSFRNTLEYDLGSVMEMFKRYFGNILADLLEFCYPHINETTEMVCCILH